MRDRRIHQGIAIALLISLTIGSGLAEEVLLCSRINAKQMPTDFRVAAMRFTGPAGDGRRGSAGFVVRAKSDEGTRLSFSFQRDVTGYGFQVIHPLGKGHAIISVHSRGMTLHRGGSWGDIGWGDPATSDKLEVNARGGVPPKANVTYRVVSELSSAGDYQMAIDGQVVCRHKVPTAKPLVLEVPREKRVWGGSGWNRTPFTGEGFKPNLQPGDVGLILGPMDAAGPNQNLQDIKLTLLPGQVAKTETPPAPQHAPTEFEPLFRKIDDAREFGKLIKSRVAGGGGGGSFESALVEPTLLVGFEYTLSTFYGGHLTVKSVRPIYMTRRGEALGEWHGVPHGKIHRVKAEQGYVVTAIVAKHGHRIDGIRLLYLRVRGGRLNPDDEYRSKWIGGLGGGGETLYATYGDPIVSIFGRQGHDLDAIGFEQIETKYK